jgi:DNA-binding NtrC family response regulator
MLPRIHVLVVEDEPLIRMDIVDFLLSEGFDVKGASGADEAMLILESDPDIQVIFTDIDMPGSMDGLKLAAVVRERWPPIRLVITSGHKVVDVVDLPDGGVFFSKPYDQSAIARSLRDIVAQN